MDIVTLRLIHCQSPPLINILKNLTMGLKVWKKGRKLFLLKHKRKLEYQLKGSQHFKSETFLWGPKYPLSFSEVKLRVRAQSSRCRGKQGWIWAAGAAPLELPQPLVQHSGGFHPSSRLQGQQSSRQGLTLDGRKPASLR